MEIFVLWPRPPPAAVSLLSFVGLTGRVGWTIDFENVEVPNSVIIRSWPALLTPLGTSRSDREILMILVGRIDSGTGIAIVVGIFRF